MSCEHALDPRSAAAVNARLGRGCLTCWLEAGAPGAVSFNARGELTTKRIVIRPQSERAPTHATSDVALWEELDETELRMMISMNVVSNGLNRTTYKRFAQDALDRLARRGLAGIDPADGRWYLGRKGLAVLDDYHRHKR